MAGQHMTALLGTRESDNVEIAAVCDVFRLRREESAQNTGARSISDYRAPNLAGRMPPQRMAQVESALRLGLEI